MTQPNADPVALADALIAAANDLTRGGGVGLEQRAKEYARRFFADSDYPAAIDRVRWTPVAIGRNPGDEIYQRAFERGREYLLQILRAMRDDALVYYQPTASLGGAPPEPIDVLRQIADRFHAVAKQLRNRHSKRPTLDVVDEYDVQDLLHALLKLWFKDIRPEDYVMQHAGAKSRVDFLLKAERMVIEVKMTRASLGEKEVGDELLIDRARYAAHPDCDTLVCFVYDPLGLISNATGLETDLAQDDKPRTVVLVRPN